MKYLLILFIILSVYSAKAIEVSGSQSGTWGSADNPYEMVGDITVPVGGTLQIEAGVELIAIANYRITVQGNLLAYGTEADTIRFHGDQGLNWGGLRFENETEQSELYYCRISNTDDTNDYGIHSINSPILVHYCHIADHQKAISLSALGAINPSYMEIKHTKIENVTKSGITVLENSNVLIDSCEVTQCGLGAQYFGAIQLSLQSNGQNCSPVISNNHIHHNGKQGITMANLYDYDYMNPTITGNIVEYNLTGIYFYSAQGTVDNNVICNNYISGNENSGAGVMLYGSSADGYFTNNEIYGNFTGFYLAAGATANIGNVFNGSDLDDGFNYIHDNIDEAGVVNSIYNDSSAEVMAQNNLWDSADPLEIAETIFDVNDDASSGEVIFEPLYLYTTPPAPENLQLEIYNPYEIYLYWEFEEILGFDRFNIYSSHEFGPYEIIGTSTGTEFTYDDMPGDGGGQYYFYVTAVNVHEIESDSSNVVEYFYVGSENNEIPANDLNMSIYPNPFNPETKILLKCEGEQTNSIELNIYNIKGQMIKKYAKSDMQYSISNNEYSVTWDGRDKQGETVNSGIYFARLKAAKHETVRKMVLLK